MVCTHLYLHKSKTLRPFHFLLNKHDGWDPDLNRHKYVYNQLPIEWLRVGMVHFLLSKLDGQRCQGNNSKTLLLIFSRKSVHGSTAE